MRTIDGKLALITGAAAGIGRAIALELADWRADLLLVDVDAERLDQTVLEARQRGVRVDARQVDLARPEEVHALAEYVRAHYGRLDILVNNAGVAYYGTSHEMTDAQRRQVIAVNLLAPLQLTHELLPSLFVPLEAHVLNLCSIAGLVGVARLAAYNTTKFGLVGFSESLSAEYGRRGLGVTALCPGVVRTGIFEKAMTSRGKTTPRFPGWVTTTPESVARRAVRAIRKNQGPVVVPGLARALWWIKRLSPSFLDRMQRFQRVRRGPAQSKPGPGQADRPQRRAA